MSITSSQCGFSVARFTTEFNEIRLLHYHTHTKKKNKNKKISSVPEVVLERFIVLLYFSACTCGYFHLWG